MIYPFASLGLRAFDEIEAAIDARSATPVMTMRGRRRRSIGSFVTPLALNAA